MSAGDRQAASGSVAESESVADWTVAVDSRAVLRDRVDRMWAVLVAVAAVSVAVSPFEHDDLA